MEALDGHEDKYTPLLSAIETVLKQAYADSPRMRDSDALAAVKEARWAVGRRGGETSRTARSILSSVGTVRREDGYTHEDVMACLCYVSASIRRHRGLEGASGYLESIAEHVA